MNDEVREEEGQVEGNRLAIMAPGRAGRPASSMPSIQSEPGLEPSHSPAGPQSIPQYNYANTLLSYIPRKVYSKTRSLRQTTASVGHPTSEHYYDSEAWETVGSQSIEVANASDDFGGADLRGSLPLWKASFSFPIELGVSVPREVDAKESVGSSNSVYVVPSDLLSAQTRMMSAGYIPCQ